MAAKNRDRAAFQLEFSLRWSATFASATSHVRTWVLNSRVLPADPKSVAGRPRESGFFSFIWTREFGYCLGWRLISMICPGQRSELRDTDTAWDTTTTKHLSSLNTVSEAHNTSHDDFNKVQEAARTKLKEYFLAEDQVRYRPARNPTACCGCAVKGCRTLGAQGGATSFYAYKSACPKGSPRKKKHCTIGCAPWKGGIGEMEHDGGTATHGPARPGPGKDHARQGLR